MFHTDYDSIFKTIDIDKEAEGLCLCYISSNDSHSNHGAKEEKSIFQKNVFDKETWDQTNVIENENFNNGIIKFTPKEKLFIFKKVYKKLGRIKKMFKKKISGTHTKFGEDNLIRKIKASFIKHVIDYINKEYENYLVMNNKQKTKLIKKILPKEGRYIKIEDNLKWFNKKIKDILSVDISERYKKENDESKYYNKYQIEKICTEKKATNVIKILEMTVIKLYEKYINNDKQGKLMTLEDELKIQKLKYKDDEDKEDYMKAYENTAKYLKSIFEKKHPRNIKKK